MPDYATQRANMVESQVHTADVTDARILHALREVPRERFVPAAKRDIAYMDRCIEVAPGRYLPDARCFAKLLQLADVSEHDKALDVGCATGYSSAVLARLAARVVALEEDPELARAAAQALGSAVTVVRGPLTAGVPAQAPFDVILLNGAVETAPGTLLEQLADGGRLVCVVRQDAAGYAKLFLKHQGAVGERTAFDAQLPLLPGFAKSSGFVF